MHTEKFSISLPADMARMIRRHVDSGDYASSSEVIRDALRLWQSRNHEHSQRLNDLREKINQAADDPRRITDEELRRHFDQRLAGTGKEP